MIHVAGAASLVILAQLTLPGSIPPTRTPSETCADMNVLFGEYDGIDRGQCMREEETWKAIAIARWKDVDYGKRIAPEHMLYSWRTLACNALENAHRPTKGCPPKN